MFGNRQKKINEYQNALMEKHYEEVENMYRTMRGWRHDYHNHIQALAAYLDAGEISKAREYLNEINETIQTVDTVLKTGNTMVDAILNSKISLMKAGKIAVDATARVPERLSVSDIDLCVIIGNLLDNAMESCLELPEENRMVRIYIAVKEEGKQLYMS
ncbi:MAG: Spo0B domain-containing protein, partial [Lachnospiraceae bacterium]|nr:Spo0B domain-containing protein [Lachnospiraceae bacterium]